MGRNDDIETCPMSVDGMGHCPYNFLHGPLLLDYDSNRSHRHVSVIKMLHLESLDSERVKRANLWNYWSDINNYFCAVQDGYKAINRL